MDRTWANNDKQSVVFTSEYLVDRATSDTNGIADVVGDWQVIDELLRRYEFLGLLDAQVIGCHGHFLCFS